MKLSTLYNRQMICSWWHSSYFLLSWWTNYIKLSLATYLLNFTTQKPSRCSLSSRAVLAVSWSWSVRSVIHLCETLIVLFEASGGRPERCGMSCSVPMLTYIAIAVMKHSTLIITPPLLNIYDTFIWKTSTPDSEKSSLQSTLLENISVVYEVKKCSVGHQIEYFIFTFASCYNM